ncbi:hypothetical protein Patl1_02576 [Pistacia atlantica]|uniref:Uncharacterized protein n=1 Tax=Pistacia atlantica TaxID=434234 RepID=A0ACC1CCZ9_9ROSI|nr:hypothetical protein Patl1_02576 [Pistacia atlantica]
MDVALAEGKETQVAVGVAGTPRMAVVVDRELNSLLKKKLESTIKFHIIRSSNGMINKRRKKKKNLEKRRGRWEVCGNSY